MKKIVTLFALILLVFTMHICVSAADEFEFKILGKDDCDITVSDGITAVDTTIGSKTGEYSTAPNMRKVKTTSSSAEVTLTYEFEVSNAGVYELSGILTSGTLNSVSKCAVSVDDSDFMKLDENYTKRGADPYNSGTKALCYVYSTSLRYNLSEGSHTFSIKFLPTSTPRVYGFFDYAGFGKVDLSELTDIKLLGATFSQDSLGASHAMGRAKGNELNWTPNYDQDTGIVKISTNADNTDEIKIDYNFSILVPGTYSFSYNGSPYNSNNLSSYDFLLDDTAKITPSAKIMTSEKASAAYTNIYDYKTNLTFELEVGEHTISVIPSGKRSDGRIYMFLELIRLEYEEEVADITITSDSEYVELNGSIEAKTGGIGAVTERIIDITDAVTQCDGSAMELNGNTLSAKKMGSVVLRAEYNGMYAEKVFYTKVNGISVRDISYYVDSEKTDVIHSGDSVIVGAEIYSDSSKKVCITTAKYKDGILTGLVQDTAFGLRVGINSYDNIITADNADVIVTYIWESMDNPSIIGEKNSIEVK